MPKEFKDDSDGCIDTWVEAMRLHLEQDNLNDVQSGGHSVEVRGSQEGRRTRHGGQDL